MRRNGWAPSVAAPPSPRHRSREGTPRAESRRTGSIFRQRRRSGSCSYAGVAVNTLTPTTRALAWCLHLLVAGLLALAAGRAVAGHRPGAVAVVAVALLLAARRTRRGPLLPAVGRSRRAAAGWLAALGVIWLGLLALSSDGVWVAFPLYFLQLHLLPRRGGLVAVAATTAAAIGAFAAHQGAFTVATALGPALGAAVAVVVVRGYQALYRESEQRRRLIEELTATRADLAAAQHAAGVLEERERLAREIHDTLAQGLSSIQLLLRAARAGPARPSAGRRRVRRPGPEGRRGQSRRSPPVRRRARSARAGGRHAGRRAGAAVRDRLGAPSAVRRLPSHRPPGSPARSARGRPAARRPVRAVEHGVPRRCHPRGGHAQLPRGAGGRGRRGRRGGLRSGRAARPRPGYRRLRPAGHAGPAGRAGRQPHRRVGTGQRHRALAAQLPVPAAHRSDTEGRR